MFLEKNGCEWIQKGTEGFLRILIFRGLSSPPIGLLETQNGVPQHNIQTTFRILWSTKKGPEDPF